MDSPNTKHKHIMFSLKQNEDLVDRDEPYLISFQQQEDHVPNLHEHVSIVDDIGINKSCINHPESSTSKRAGNRLINKPNLGGGCCSGAGGVGEDDRALKKMLHREIERQRRQDMTMLYGSLRNLLPIEFVKGNRSISDHMHQAVHYIKQTEENVTGLSMRRDMLKNNESLMNHLLNTVSVNFCNGGVEILINSCTIEDGFHLSRVLRALVEEGLNVTSCTSTQANDRLLHSIQTEANLASLDQSMLQERLMVAAVPNNILKQSQS
ncbi:transcription factor bHLH118-like protein [Tanacetum coccineum]